MTLTKQDIDALVDGVPEAESNPERVTLDAHTYIRRDLLRRTLYLAAGLTAEGERKPERVRCWQWTQRSDGCDGGFSSSPPNTDSALINNNNWRVTPGWFVPDGAE